MPDENSSRAEAVKIAEKYGLANGSAFGRHTGLADCIARDISELPAADVAEVVHGEWETNSDRPDSLICSVCKCGFDMWKHDPHNYCPNCGARMDGWMEDADNG